jgi:hypothetical protein
MIRELGNAEMPSQPGDGSSPPPYRRDDLDTGPEPAIGSRYLYTYRQAAHWIGVHPRTIQIWIKSGRIPPFNIITRRVHRITGDALARIIDSYTASPPAEPLRRPRRPRRAA